MSEQHTNGPWEAVPGRRFNHSDNGWVVETVRGGFPLTGWGAVETHEANARLISAAPELLEACQISMRRAKAGNTFSDGELDLILAAITKATQAGKE